MRRLCTLLLTILLCICGALPAHAQTDVIYIDSWDDGAATVLDQPDNAVTANSTTEEVTTYPTAAADSAAAVVSFDTPRPQYGISTTEDGMPLIQKTYTLSPDAEPPLGEAFEQDGVHFTLRNILREELPGETLTRTATKTAVASTNTDAVEDILAQFPDAIDHTENGYTGQLTLNAASLSITPEEYETYYYTYTDTQEVHGLTRNDPALLEKERPGMTMAGVSFKAQGETYTALATWQGTATDKRPVRFTTTATYFGEISKAVPGDILYTLIYEGAPVTAAVTEKQEASDVGVAESSAADIPVSDQNGSGRVVLFLVGAVYPLGLTTLFIIRTTKERKMRRENREVLAEIVRFIRSEG